MIPLSFFKSLGSFIENVLFVPYDFFRITLSNWWVSNVINWIFVLIGFIAFFYWMGQMFMFKKQDVED